MTLVLKSLVDLPSAGPSSWRFPKATALVTALRTGGASAWLA